MFRSTVADCLGLGFRGRGSPVYWLNAREEVGSSLSLSYPVYKMKLGVVLSVSPTPQSRRSHCHQSVGAWPTLFSDEERLEAGKETCSGYTVAEQERRPVR